VRNSDCECCDILITIYGHLLEGVIFLLILLRGVIQVLYLLRGVINILSSMPRHY
jgi:hypothetical protein